MDELETALYLFNEYVTINCEFMHKESFTHDMIRDVCELMNSQFETSCEDVISHALVLFQRGRTSYLAPSPCDNIDSKIHAIRLKPQPKQKTPEWYEYRHKLLTASSIYKALGSDAKQRELLTNKQSVFVAYENTCVEGPMHWGVKYEPVSIQYYSYINHTVVEEFGCVTHDTYTFLGASPDGINVNPASPLYGRMLEIKNPFTRVINGTPKEEYWVQCQVQMEVCDLNACDFLETKFIEYESEEAFREDGTFLMSVDGKYKGTILQFFTDKVVYEYAPFQCTEAEYETWKDECMNVEQRSWIKTIHWKLDDVSCLLILRNKDWFQLMLPLFQQFMQKL